MAVSFSMQGASMNKIWLVSVGFLAVVVCGCSSSSTTPNGGRGDTNGPDAGVPTNVAEKIVGKWEQTIAAGQPTECVWEFRKDGGLLILVPTAITGGVDATLQFSYQVNGTNVTITRMTPDGKQEQETRSVKVLTDDKLILAQEGGEAHFKRKK